MQRKEGGEQNKKDENGASTSHDGSEAGTTGDDNDTGKTRDDNKAGTSRDHNEADTSADENDEAGTSLDIFKKDNDNDSMSESICSSCKMEVEGDERYVRGHRGTRKMRPERRVKRRKPVGRVEKRKGRKNKRKPTLKLRRARSHSGSSRGSRRRHSAPCRLRCTNCGHSLYMTSKKIPAYVYEEIKKTKKNVHRGTDPISQRKIMSECIQIGSKSQMLSPLYVSSSYRPQGELLESPTAYGEITPEMIFESVKWLTMMKEEVHFSCILKYMQAKYPINATFESAATELADKLYIANLAGLVWALPDDYWRLPTALESLRRPEQNHVTLFWRLYVDTVRPLKMNAKPEKRDTGAGTHQMFETSNETDII